MKEKKEWLQYTLNPNFTQNLPSRSSQQFKLFFNRHYNFLT